MTFKLKSALAGAMALGGALLVAAPAMATPTPLGSMPSGSVTLRHTHGRKLAITLDALGLTPGSSHEMKLSPNACNAGSGGGGGVHVVTADASGQLRAGFRVSKRKASKAASVSVLLGTPGASGGGVSANQSIACANIPKPLKGSVHLPLRSRLGWGSQLSGGYMVTYSAAAKTLTVDVSARGFVPGSLHAAHIHAGSCQRQGPVVYMLQDLVADASGDIHATRTVTGVTSPPPATGWYLNIHLGDSNHILAGGKPTLAFQPLLCGNVDQVQNAPTAVAVGSGGERFLSGGQSVVLGTVGHFTFSSTCSKDSNGQNQVTFDVTADTSADLDGNGPMPAGTKINIHTDSDALDNQSPGAFAQVGSASSSTEIAADGQEVDVFYNDGVNWPAGAGTPAHDCFAGYSGLATGLPS
jgi:CHRD domain